MTDEYDLPSGFMVAFQIRHAALEAEWSPRLPTAEEFPALLQSYRAARDHFLGGLGLQVLVIEQ